MAYHSLYLKYRPQTFTDVIGQDHVCRTLRNAVAQGKVAHAYLFCGPRGTGKTTTARVLAKALCCAASDGPTPDPCGECDACTGIRDSSLLDVVELDAASNRGIDEVRNLKEVIGFPPTWVRYKVFIIDEVHQMTKEAFNALLKTLEEPPDHAFFILATTDPQKVPITILSRCQRFDFRRVSLRDIGALLGRSCEAEGIRAEEPGLLAIARLADGCVRDAITTLDQVAAYTGGEVTLASVNEVVGAPGFDMLFALSDILARGAAAEVFAFVEGLTAEGKSYAQVLEALLGHLRNLLIARLGAATEAGLEVDAPTVKRYQEQAASFEAHALAAAIREVSRSLDEMRWNGQHRIVTEVALASIAGGFAAPQTHDETAAATPPPKRGRSRAAPAPVSEPPSEPPSPHEPPVPDEPETATEAPPEPATGEWQRVVVAVVTERPSLGSVLRESRAEASGGRLSVIFTNKFQHASFEKALGDRDTRAAVERAIEAAYGRTMGVACEFRPEARPAPASEPSLLDAVLETFEGSEVVDDAR